MAEGAGVDFRLVKALFSQILPPGDPLLQAALQESDWFSKADGIPRLQVYFRLYSEREAKGRGGP